MTPSIKRLVFSLAGVALVSRLVVVSAAYLAPAVWPSELTPGQWHRTDTVTAPLLRWDAGYYLEIADRGYTHQEYAGGTTTVAFFPVYPLLVRLVAMTGIGSPLAAVLLSNTLFVLAIPIIALAALAAFDRRQLQDYALEPESLAWRTSVLLCLFPWSCFGSFPYTESLFLLLAATSLYFLAHQRTWATASFSAVASATRPVGIALAAALALESLLRRRRRLSDILAIGLAGLGLLAFMAFLATEFGSPFAFAEAQRSQAWGRLQQNPVAVLVKAPFRSLYRLAHGDANLLDLDIWLLIAATTALVATRRVLPRSWSAYAFVCLAMPVASGSLLAMGRFLMPLLPVHAATVLLIGRRAWAWRAIVVIYVLGSVYLSGRYATWRWAG